LTKLFDVFVNGLEEWPVMTTRTFPELDRVIIVYDKESFEFFEDSSQVYLGWMDRKVEDKSCYTDRVSNDNDF